MDFYSRQVKRRLIKTRMTALLSAILGIVCVLFYYLKIVDSWVCIICLSYSMGISFIMNSSYQELHDSKTWRRLNMILGLLFFLITIGIIIYAFASKNIRF